MERISLVQGLQSRHPESKRLVVQSPNDQASRVQISSVQASSSPVSKEPAVRSSGEQNSKFLSSRVQAFRTCVQGPDFPLCHFLDIVFLQLSTIANI